MDLPCSTCGEPWENDSIHDRAKETGSTYAKVAAAFRVQGCVALGAKHNEVSSKVAPYAAVAYDLLGDDMDGAAAMLEDLGDIGDE